MIDNATVTFTGTTKIMYTEETALTYEWTIGNHAMTVSGLSIVNATDGVDVYSAPGANVAVTIASSTFQNIFDTAVYVDGGNSIVLTVNDVTVPGLSNGEPSYAGIFATCPKNLTANFNGLSVNDTDYGVFLASTNSAVVGNVDFTINNADITNCSAYGIWLETYNGTISATVDPSNFSYNSEGLYLDAATTMNVMINDTTFYQNSYGVDVYAVTAVNVRLSNDTFNDNYYGMYADLDTATLSVNVQSCSFTDTTYGLEMWTYAQGINLNIGNSNFNLGDYAVLANALGGNLTSNVVNTTFLGQQSSGLGLASVDNITSTVSDSTFNGTSANDWTYYQPATIQAQYAILDPGYNYTFDPTMNVELPWTFEFNGVDYNFVNMSMNGLIAFGFMPSTDAIYSFGYYSPNMVVAAQYPWATNQTPGWATRSCLRRTPLCSNGMCGTLPSRSLRTSSRFGCSLMEASDQVRPMDGSGLTTYDYGINEQYGLNWNLNLWSARTRSTISWMSVALTRNDVKWQCNVLRGLGQCDPDPRKQRHQLLHASGHGRDISNRMVTMSQLPTTTSLDWADGPGWQ